MILRDLYLLPLAIPPLEPNCEVFLCNSPMHLTPLGLKLSIQTVPPV